MRMLTLGILVCGLLPGFPAAGAALSGVTLSGHGGAGDACTGIYQAEEGFGSGNLSAASFLTYAGSAVGLDNGWPGGGCAASPVFAHVSASGSAQPGLLRADAAADMESVALLSASSDIIVTYFDKFTSITGGTYLFTFSFNGSLSATPACPGSALSRVVYDTTLAANLVFSRVNWTEDSCTPNAPVQVYGGYTLINSDTVQVTVGMARGGTVTVSSSLEAKASAGLGQSGEANFSDTAVLDVVGLNGATYSTASGVVYDATDAPEPESWALLVCSLGVVFVYSRLVRPAALDRSNST